MCGYRYFHFGRITPTPKREAGHVPISPVYILQLFSDSFPGRASLVSQFSNRTDPGIVLSPSHRERHYIMRPTDRIWRSLPNNKIAGDITGYTFFIKAVQSPWNGPRSSISLVKPLFDYGKREQAKKYGSAPPGQRIASAENGAGQP
jgi:hypothetical protein